MIASFFSFRDLRRRETVERDVAFRPPSLAALSSKGDVAWIAWRERHGARRAVDAIDRFVARSELDRFGPDYELEIEARVAAVRALKQAAGKDGPSLAEVDAALAKVPTRFRNRQHRASARKGGRS